VRFCAREVGAEEEVSVYQQNHVGDWLEHYLFWFGVVGEILRNSQIGNRNVISAQLVI